MPPTIEPWTLGVLFSITGHMAIPSQQHVLGVELAVEEVNAAVSGFDAVVTLPAFGEAPEGLGYTGDAEYCAPWTLLGVPAVTLPAGFGKNGLPLGVQIVGAHREDHLALGVAKWIESVPKFDPGIPGI